MSENTDPLTAQIVANVVGLRQLHRELALRTVVAQVAGQAEGEEPRFGEGIREVTSRIEKHWNPELDEAVAAFLEPQRQPFPDLPPNTVYLSQLGDVLEDIRDEGWDEGAKLAAGEAQEVKEALGEPDFNDPAQYAAWHAARQIEGWAHAANPYRYDWWAEVR